MTLPPTDSREYFLLRPIAAASIVMFAQGVALAADLPSPIVKAPRATPAVYDWNGLYLGANVGDGMAIAKSQFNANDATFATVNNGFSGALAGGQVGYNYQIGRGLLGIETDVQWSNIGGTISMTCPSTICVPATNASVEQKVTMFGTVRGRLGYAFDGWLAYVTGGYAYGRVATNATAVGGGVTATFNQSEMRDGWTLGGGVELALTQRWSAKLEYLYLDMGTKTNIGTLAGLPTITDYARVSMSVARVGLNYGF
jgi:outer membrane immunogenic protein